MAGLPKTLAISDSRRTDGARMESSGRNRCNQWQMGRARKPLNQANRQPVATHGNRFAAHGKEGVDGSSPSEGFCKVAAAALAMDGGRRSVGFARRRLDC